MGASQLLCSAGGAAAAPPAPQNTLRLSMLDAISFRTRHTGRICFFDISGN